MATVNNVAPVLNDVMVTSPIDEAGTTTLSGTIIDPGSLDAFTLVITWGDGSVDTTINLPAGSTGFVADHDYADNGAYDITFTLADDDQTANGAAVVVVNNLDPVMTLDGALTADEGAAYAITFSAVDVPADTLVGWTIDWGDGSPVENLAGDAAGATHTFADDGLYTVVVTTADDDGGIATRQLVVAVENVDPTVSVGGDATVNEGSVYTLNLSAVDDPGDDMVLGWSIDWGDGATEPILGNPASVTHIYSDNGEYAIVALAMDDDGAYTAFGFVQVFNVAPTITADGPAQISEGSTYTLVLTADEPGDDIVSWLVDWGDGAADSATGVNVTLEHVFVDGPVTPVVTITASDEDLGVNVAQQAVTVNNVAPAVTLVGAADSNEGSQYTLEFSASDPGDDSTIWLIAWGDGSVEEFTGSAGLLTHIYADNGDFTIVATAVDDDGDSGMETLPVAVADVAPVITLVGDAAVNEGAPYILGFSSSDPGDDPVSLWTIDWGDGSEPEPFAAAGSAVHVFPDGDAIYTVTVSVDNGDGTFTRTMQVAATNVSPVVALSGVGEIDEAALYTVGIAIEDVGDDTVSAMLIDWGDGTAPEAIAPAAVTASHVYADNDDYTITLTVTDDDGQYVAQHTVAVIDVPPTLTLEGDALLDEGDALTITFSATDPGDDALTDWIVDWGDDTAPEPLAPDATEAIHTFVQNGEYTIMLTALDEDGAYTIELPIIVNNVAPTAVLTGDTFGVRGQIRSYNAVLGDVGLADALEVRWDFGDGTVFDFEPLEETDESAVNHIFAQSGIYTVAVTVRDSDGAETTATQTVQVDAIQFQRDPFDPMVWSLFVGGTPGNDSIVFKPNSGAVQVFFNGRSYGTYLVDGHVVAYGQSGNDALLVRGALPNPVVFFGGANRDTLYGGSADDVLVGGAWNDFIRGYGGNDLLIGSAGADRIEGGDGDDMMVAQASVYDDDLETLVDVMSLWNDPLTAIEDRALAISNVFNELTLIADERTDVLRSGNGLNWLLANDKDSILASDEDLIDLF